MDRPKLAKLIESFGLLGIVEQALKVMAVPKAKQRERYFMVNSQLSIKEWMRQH